MHVSNILNEDTITSGINDNIVTLKLHTTNLWPDNRTPLMSPLF